MLMQDKRHLAGGSSKVSKLKKFLPSSIIQ